MLSRITIEIAQTIIDDSDAAASQNFSKEALEQLESINYNIDLWVADEERNSVISTAMQNPVQENTNLMNSIPSPKGIIKQQS